MERTSKVCSGTQLSSQGGIGIQYHEHYRLRYCAGSYWLAGRKQVPLKSMRSTNLRKDMDLRLLSRYFRLLSNDPRVGIGFHHAGTYSQTGMSWFGHEGFLTLNAATSEIKNGHNLVDNEIYINKSAHIVRSMTKIFPCYFWQVASKLQISNENPINIKHSNEL